MNYRTTCPRCGSVFRLGEDQLKAADGWAQCGVCGENFDTHATLLLEDGSPLAGPIPTRDNSTAPAGAGVSQATAQQADDSRNSEPERLPSIILIDPDIPPPDDFGPLPAIPDRQDVLPAPAPSANTADGSPSARVEYAEPPATGDVARESVSKADHEAPRDEASDEIDGEASAEATTDFADASFDAYVPRRKRTWAWALASLVLLTLLGAQLAYFLRDPLVTHMPQARPAMERMCALLDCTLSLPKNLALLQIVGSDLETESAEHLTLTLTLGNRAPYTQAWPVLVLTLTDQANRPLARRSFAPAEYLGGAQRVAAGIAPRSEQPLALALAVRDLRPMGFDLKLVY